MENRPGSTAAQVPAEKAFGSGGELPPDADDAVGVRFRGKFLRSGLGPRGEVRGVLEGDTHEITAGAAGLGDEQGAIAESHRRGSRAEGIAGEVTIRQGKAVAGAGGASAGGAGTPGRGIGGGPRRRAGEEGEAIAGPVRR